MNNISNGIRNKMITIVLIGAFISLLAETLFNNSLTDIMDAFNVSQSTVQWLSTGYLLIVGLMIPISSWIFNNFKSKNSYVFMISIFMIGSFVGMISKSFFILFIGRMIQAIASGMLMPYLQNIILILFPPNKRGFAMGLTGLVISLGPTLGPTLSGLVLHYFSWRVLFFILFFLSLIIVILALFLTYNINHIDNYKMDVPSLIYSIIGFGGLLYAFSLIGNDGNVSIISIFTIIIGITFITIFFKRQSSINIPLISINVFKNKRFNLTLFIGTIVNIALLGIELIFPLYLQNSRMTSPLISGIIMIPGAIAMGFLNPLTGILYDKKGIKFVTTIGFIIIIFGSLPMIFFDNKTSLFIISMCYAIRMSGIAFIIMNTFTDGINSLNTSEESDGNAASSTIRQIGGSLGTALSMMFVSLGFNSINNNALAFTNGYHYGFILMLLISIIGLLSALFLPFKNKD